MGLYTLPGKEELYLYGYGKQFGDKLTYTAGVSYAAGRSWGDASQGCLSEVEVKYVR